MSRNVAPLTLGPPAAALLRRGLEAIARTSAHAHARRSARVALTVRPCLHARDVPPGRPIPATAWRLMALSHRWCVGRGVAACRRILLVIYKPVLDLPGSGRIRLVCERVVDLTARGEGALDPELRPADARVAVLLHQAALDTDAGDLADVFDLPAAYFLYPADRPPVLEETHPAEAWRAARFEVDGLMAYPAWMLARPAGGTWGRHPGDGSACPFDPGEVVLSEGVVRGGWVVRDGLPVPLAQAPERVVAFPGFGRAVRNPAFAALQGHGLIDPGLGYRAWLDTVTRPAPAGRAARAPGDPASAAGRLRRGVADYALGDLDVLGRSARLEGLLGDLRHGCEAVGVPLPGDPGEEHDALLALLEDPWSPASVPSAAPVVVLAGSADGPARFGNGVSEVDLDDLGVDGDRYRRASSGVIRAALGGPSRRAGRRASVRLSAAC